MTTETKVGVFVITAVVLLAAIVCGVHTTRTVRGQVRFKTYLRDAGGLDADTSVLFGGIKVGRITTVRPDTDDPTRIEIAFEVKAGTPMNDQSKARVGAVSLMGTPSLQITTGRNEAPRLAPGAVVPSEESVSTSELTRRVGVVVDNANNVLLDLHREIPEIAAQLHSVLDNVKTLTGAENQQQIRTVLAGVRTLVNDTDAVIVSAKPLMGNIDQTVSNVSRTFDSVRGTVDALREPLVDDLKALHDTLEDARACDRQRQGRGANQRGRFRRDDARAPDGVREPADDERAAEGAPVEPDSDNAGKRSKGSRDEILTPVDDAGRRVRGRVRQRPLSEDLHTRLDQSSRRAGATAGPWRGRRSRLQQSGLPVRRPNRVSARAYRSRLLRIPPVGNDPAPDDHRLDRRPHSHWRRVSGLSNPRRMPPGSDTC